MSIEELKINLLKLECILDNEYLDDYINLIWSNIATQKKKWVTQAHHFIPIAYYKTRYSIKNRSEILEVAENDPNNFKVNLMYKDHVLAHYYLALCSTGKFKYQNENAIFHVLGNINYLKTDSYREESAFIRSLEKFQVLYSDMIETRSKNYTGRHCKPNTEKHKKQISDKNKGKIYIRKYVDDKWVSKKINNIEEYSSYQKEGWELGNIPRNACNNNTGVSQNISKAKKGKICINNGKVNKYIDPKDLKEYEKQGWIKGVHKCFIRQRVLIKKANRTLCIYIDEIDRYLDKGWSICGDK